VFPYDEDILHPMLIWRMLDASGNYLSECLRMVKERLIEEALRQARVTAENRRGRLRHAIGFMRGARIGCMRPTNASVARLRSVQTVGIETIRADVVDEYDQKKKRQPLTHDQSLTHERELVHDEVLMKEKALSEKVLPRIRPYIEPSSSRAKGSRAIWRTE
jgi:hypothetical protein